MGFDFSPPADDHFTLDGNNGLKDVVLETHGLDSNLEGVDDFVFVAGIGVDDIPGGVDAGGIGGELE